MPLFGNLTKKPKSPAELVARLHNSLQALEELSQEVVDAVYADKPKRDKEAERICKETNDFIGQIKALLATPPAPQQDAAAASRREHDVDNGMKSLLTLATVPSMIRNLHRLSFETRRDVVAIFTFVCKYKKVSSQLSSAPAGGTYGRVVADVDLPSSYPGLEYIRSHPEVENALCDGYDDPHVALHCGAMLQVCIKDRIVAARIIGSNNLDKFFKYMQNTAFEIASDAFITFKKLLTQHKEVTADHVRDNHERFFQLYEQLLTSKNFATQRQSIQLLADLLTSWLNQKEYVHVMYKYVRSARNLMVVMNLLLAPSVSISYEAFHVFKLFIANPKKPEGVRTILTCNREKLLRFLRNFLSDREAEDETFAAEKAEIMNVIESIVPENGQAAGADAKPSADSSSLSK